MRRFKHGLLALIFAVSCLSTQASWAGAKCTGHFINPITDICWSCLFPLSIGSAHVVGGDRPDTDNPGSPVCVCPMTVGYRVGINFGYWEPFAITDVTRQPFCMVNLGGVQLHLGMLKHDIGAQSSVANPNGMKDSFYWVHWYKYPLLIWLNILTDLGCLENGNMDIAYLSEIDPTWHDDSLSFVLNPEAALFGSAPAQTACLADALKTATGHNLPIDSLFWCLGSQGSAYPLDGSVAAQSSPIQAAVLLSERMDFKLHREALIWDSSASHTCSMHYAPVLPKSRYRYQQVNTVPKADACYPFGTNTAIWEGGHAPINGSNNFGFLIWRKRNCCYA